MCYNAGTMSTYLATMLDDLYVKPVFTSLDDCYQQGKAASDQCYGRGQNPYPAGTAVREWWDGGWLNSMDELTGQ